jgi:hypothetical protein
MHQSFRWNGTDYYTVFQLPISVTNSISESDERVDCVLLENEVLSVADVDESSDSLPGQPWVEGASTTDSSASPTQTGMGLRSHSGSRRMAVIAIAATMILHFLS